MTPEEEAAWRAIADGSGCAACDLDLKHELPWHWRAHQTSNHPSRCECEPCNVTFGAVDAVDQEIRRGNE